MSGEIIGTTVSYGDHTPFSWVPQIWIDVLVFRYKSVTRSFLFLSLAHSLYQNDGLRDPVEMGFHTNWVAGITNTICLPAKYSVH